jgi:hypothetical protein
VHEQLGDARLTAETLGHAGLGSVAGYTKITAARRRAVRPASWTPASDHPCGSTSGFLSLADLDLRSSPIRLGLGRRTRIVAVAGIGERAFDITGCGLRMAQVGTCQLTESIQSNTLALIGTDSMTSSTGTMWNSAWSAKAEAASNAAAALSASAINMPPMPSAVVQ